MMQELFDALGQYIEKKTEAMHTALPGTIVSFNPQTGLAVVRPQMKYKTKDGQKLDYPDISSVPVVIPQANAQGVTIAYPIKAGDGCLLIMSEQSNDYFLYGQETDTDLKFDLSNAIAIVGLFRTVNQQLVRACSMNEIVLANGNNVFSIGSSGVKIEGNLTVTGSVIAPSVKAGGVEMAGHIHRYGSNSPTSGPE